MTVLATHRITHKHDQQERNKMKKSIFLALMACSALLAGCVSVPLTSASLDSDAKKFQPEAGKSSMYINRKNAIFGGGVMVQSVVDGRMVGSLAPGTYQLISVAPGEHIVTTSGQFYGVKQTRVNTEQGKNYFFDISVGIGWITPNINIKRTEEEEGRKCVTASKRAETSTCSAPSHNPLPARVEGASLVNELSQKLDALGSFQAEYRAVSGDTPAKDITVLFNNDRQYGLIKAAAIGTKEPDVYFVFDFSQLNDKSGSMKMLIASGKEGKRCEISMNDLMNHLDNPLGVLSFMAMQIQSEAVTNTGMTSLQGAGPNLSLGLDSNNIVMGAGFSCESTNLMVSWLDPNTILNAIDIVETPESVQFSYPDNHVVLVDRKTGLLLRDSMPHPAKTGLGEIVLQSYSAHQNPVPYASIIPGFDKIKFEELPQKLLYAQMFDSYFSAFGSQLAAMGNFDEMLRTNSVKIANAARNAARRMAREDAKAKADKKSAVKFRDKALVPAYKSYLQNPPVDVKDLSFSNLLDMAMAMAETNSSILVPPDALALIERTKSDSQNIISRLPGDARAPLIKLSDAIMPAMIEGLMLEYFRANIEEIRALGIPEFNAEQAAAYGKRGSMEQKNGNLAGAMADFGKALELKPGNAAIEKKLREVKAQMNEEASPP